MLWPMRSPLLRASYRTPHSAPGAHAGAALAMATAAQRWQRPHQPAHCAAVGAATAPTADAAGSPFMLPQSHDMDLAGYDLSPCLEEAAAQAPPLSASLSTDAQEFTPGAFPICERTTPELGQAAAPRLPPRAPHDLQLGLLCAGRGDRLPDEALVVEEYMAESYALDACVVDGYWVDGYAVDGYAIDTSAACVRDAGTLAQQRQSEAAPRIFNGWTVVWVGDRAFRAVDARKAEISSMGFLVKVYKNQDKCCRALDKKPTIPKSTVFLVSEAESRQLVSYLRGRGAGGLRVVIDAEGAVGDAERLREELGVLEDSADCPTIAHSWEEVVSSLCSIGVVAAAPAAGHVQQLAGRAPQHPVHPRREETAKLAGATARTAAEPAAFERGPRGGPSRATGAADSAALGTLQAEGGAAASGGDGAEGKWTLVWVSELAFKPTAVTMKARLEALGCQVKGYKAHRNATRALDKKRALVRTVALVSGGEATPLLAYFASRPELGAVPLVVEASQRTLRFCSSEAVEVAEDFEAAVAMVQRIATDAGWT